MCAAYAMPYHHRTHANHKPATHASETSPAGRRVRKQSTLQEASGRRQARARGKRSRRTTGWHHGRPELPVSSVLDLYCVFSLSAALYTAHARPAYDGVWFPESKRGDPVDIVVVGILSAPTAQPPTQMARGPAGDAGSGLGDPSEQERDDHLTPFLYLSGVDLG